MARMSKTSARFNLADISRATEAAKAEGAAAVEILPDGTIRIVINEMHCDEKPETEDDERDLADALYLPALYARFSSEQAQCSKGGRSFDLQGLRR